MAADNTLRLAFILSATDKMSRTVNEAVKKSSDKLSSFERTTGKVGRSMMKAGAVMVGTGAAIGGAMLGIAKSTADYGNTAAKAARSVGMDAEEYQKLAYAAKYAGVDQQKFSASMVKFNKNVVDAASGSKTAGQVFKDLGIKLKDSEGNLRAPNEILADVADVFKNTKDGAGKTALAYELLGRSGADMISLLNSGSDGLEAMGKEAEKLGMVISSDAAHASEDFCDNLDRVKDSARGVVFQLGAALMPAINDMAIKVKEAINKVTEWMQKNPQLAATIGKVGLGLAALLVTVGTASILFGGLTFIVGKFATVFRAASAAIKAGKAILTACKNSMLLFRVQYAALVVWQKLAAVAQWLFNSALFACPVVWIVAAIMAIIAAVVLLVKYWDKVAAFFKKIWAAIVGVFTKAWDGIKKVWGAVTGWFSGLWGGIKGGASKAWNGIKNTIGKASEGVKKVWGATKGWFSNLWGGVKDATGKAWDAIKSSFLNYTPQGLIIKHWDKITGWFSGLWDNIKNNISGTWESIKGWFTGLNPVEWISGAWDSVGAFFGGLGTRFYEWGKNILMGLWNGITSMVNKVVEGVKNIGHKIAKGFKAIFGINSPSKLFAEYGMNITQGLIVGIDHGGGAVESATEGLAANTTSGINQSMQSSSVDASKTFNAGNSGTTLNYSPQITITGTASPEIRDEFSKMLKQHANEIVSIIRRDAENTARLSFNA